MAITLNKHFELYLGCVVGTIGLGLEAGFIGAFKSGYGDIVGLIMVGIPSAFIAFFIAHILFPIVWFCNRRKKHFRRNILLTFAIAAIPTGLYTVNFAYGPLSAKSSIIPAVVSVMIVSFIVFIADRRDDRQQTDHCPVCNYCLRGVITHGCPECGWKRKEMTFEDHSDVVDFDRLV